MKTLKTTTTKLYCYISTAFLMACAGVSPIYGDTNIFDAGGNLADSLFNQIKDLYVGKLFPLLLVVNLVLLAFTKDDKKVALLKRTLITICVVFIAMHLVSLITSTLTGFSETMTGAGAGAEN